MVYRSKALSEIDWEPVTAALRASARIALATHIRPDTDGIGSEVALHRGLSRLGKDVRILNPDPLLERLHFLDPDRAVQKFRREDAKFLSGATLVVVDTSERDRLGPIADFVGHGGATSICIDHHVNEHRRFATLDLIVPRAASTGVLICALLEELGVEFDQVIAQAIYATLVADTGSFRFSNTDSGVFRLAGDLLDLGADPHQVNRGVLGDYSAEKLKLLSYAIQGSGLECDGRLSWFAVSRQMLEEASAAEEDAEGLVEYLRLQRGVRAVVYFIEREDKKVRVSFRSEDGLDVRTLASRWGGGGHRHAAGALLPGPLERVVTEVVDTAKAALFPDTIRRLSPDALSGR